MTRIATPRLGAIFRRRSDLSALPNDLRLRNLEWGVLFATTGEHTVSQIAEHLDIAPDAGAEVFARLLEHDLIEEREVTYDEYVRANATISDAEPRTLGQFLSGVSIPAPGVAAGLESTTGDAAQDAEAPPSDDALSFAVIDADVAAEEATIDEKTSFGTASTADDVVAASQPREPSTLDTTPLETFPLQPPTLDAPSVEPPVSVEPREAATDADKAPASEPISTQAPPSPLPPAPADADEARPEGFEEWPSVGSSWRGDDSLTQPLPPFDPKALGFRPLGADAPAPKPTTLRPVAPPPEPPTGPRAADASGDRTNARRLSLKALMRFILDRSPDRNAGQLDVYRVFIRVDTKLLKRNGIETLRFEEDRLVADSELQRAITSSVERTLGLQVPDSVYRDAA
ncbi:MAG: hypothetical protein AAGN46_05910 [Acidobacteriota bacterium]